MDLDNNSNLKIVRLQNNNISNLNILNNTLLTYLSCDNNQLDAAVNSQLLVDLDSHNLSNGYFRSSIYAGGTLTAAGTTAKNALLAKGWTIVGL